MAYLEICALHCDRALCSTIKRGKERDVMINEHSGHSPDDQVINSRDDPIDATELDKVVVMHTITAYCLHSRAGVGAGVFVCLLVNYELDRIHLGHRLEDMISFTNSLSHTIFHSSTSNCAMQRAHFVCFCSWTRLHSFVNVARVFFVVFVVAFFVRFDARLFHSCLD